MWPVLVSLLFVAGCKRLAADASNAAVFQPVQVSGADVDAAEPVTTAAPDGSVYVSWVNHADKNQADVMLARFNGEGARSGPAVRVNRTRRVERQERNKSIPVGLTRSRCDVRARSKSK
jgi:hypothetical protein